MREIYFNSSCQRRSLSYATFKVHEHHVVDEDHCHTFHLKVSTLAHPHYVVDLRHWSEAVSWMRTNER